MFYIFEGTHENYINCQSEFAFGLRMIARSAIL